MNSIKPDTVLFVQSLHRAMPEKADFRAAMRLAGADRSKNVPCPERICPLTLRSICYKIKSISDTFIDKITNKLKSCKENLRGEQKYV